MAKPIDSNLDLQGNKLINAKQESFSPGSLIVTGATTLDATHYTVALNAATSTTAAVFTLPNPATCIGRVYPLESQKGIINLAVTGGSTVFDGPTAIASIGNTQKIIIQSNGTNWRSLTPLSSGAGGGAGSLITESGAIFSDFTFAPTTTTPGIAIATAGAGAGVTPIAPTATNRQGVIQLSTGTTATGRIHVGDITGLPIVLGNGAVTHNTAINIQALSAAAERYQLLIGLFDTFTAVNQVDGAYLLYDEGGVTTGSTASANWQRVTAANSVRTLTASTTAVAAGWLNIRVEVNAAGTLVEYFVEGVSVGTIATNIPNGITRTVGFGIYLQKSVGLTARTVHADWLYLKQNFSAAPRGVW
jgi:hypothetical protein